MITKILSLDGGGSKGVFHIYFLNAFESALNRCMRDSFDYIGGTSVGGILSIALTHPLLWMGNQNNFAVADMLEKKIDEKLLSVIFGPPRSCWMPPRLGLLGPKYKDREKHIQSFYDNEFFGKQKFGDHCAKPTMVFSYSLTENAAKVFKSWRPSSQDVPVSTVALATSAAPMFFPAVSYKGDVLIDGGVAVNDPSYLIGYEARKNAGNLQSPLIVISLGTSVRGSTDYTSCYNGGLAAWASKFIGLSMETQQRIVTYLQGHDSNCCLYCNGCVENHFHEVLGPNQNCFADYHCWNNVHYFRFAPCVDAILDSTDPQMLNKLKSQAASFFDGSSKIVAKMLSLMNA
ncbi:MAG: patatin-like phospholipase family protein [Pseudomonadota bacterium]